MAALSNYFFFDRDLSWLSFNERVLMEAEDDTVPLLERINFLSIYSSNLDEFYRVRMPALTALQKLYQKQKVKKQTALRHEDVAGKAKEIILEQQSRFGEVLHQLLPQLQAHQLELVYGKPIPPQIMPQVSHYFFTQVLAFLKPIVIAGEGSDFFPENNMLYLALIGKGHEDTDEIVVVNIPTEHLSRFFQVEKEGKFYVVFLDDIIKAHLHVIPRITVEGSFSFKVTRDAELELEDEYEEDIATKIEKQIEKRDAGLATRFLHEPGIPEKILWELINNLGLSEAVIMQGGRYHNLKDLSTISVNLPHLKYRKWPAVQLPCTNEDGILEEISKRDILLHVPYQSYDTVLRFFNEAAIRTDVEHIYLTMYRVANESRIVNALLSAAHNGKKVTVLIELKARFDEANNLKWAKKLKKAGVEVLFTSIDLKVHAKLALVKRKIGPRIEYAGLLATGNLNESTARFYTDHILLTSNTEMLKEVEKVFQLFKEKEKTKEKYQFENLLVGKHNLQEKFLELLDREIRNAHQGLPARVIIKVNNIEERELICKLYDASNADVKIQLLVRGICCLVPGVPGMSQNITVRRIVDRYLEHGRIFIFHNNGSDEVFLGSSDWMNRNIYKRIEVCFPLYNEDLKTEIKELIDIQLNDSLKAVVLNQNLQNVRVMNDGELVQSQDKIYNKLAFSKAKGVYSSTP
ncbi:polyphosphate kinase 1 [Segetibacter aerophilus]|uniref:Polyphosphate kinase n=1 Tax=Segetibacter aerophilus TaxID=670293 RepID=A0A512BFM2_9BACT|nr:polyphosphate kinase 1 [Segetibacter aerophilus]GEO10754.1 polyphosphate kinase [Segetibacter aerophilus]